MINIKKVAEKLGYEYVDLRNSTQHEKSMDFKFRIENYLKGEAKQVTSPFISFFWNDGAYMFSITIFIFEFQIWFGDISDVKENL